jgi:hypothetical protein
MTEDPTLDAGMNVILAQGGVRENGSSSYR